jgi:hypothetical protein
LTLKSLALALKRFAFLCDEHSALPEEKILLPRTASLLFSRLSSSRRDIDAMLTADA